MIADKPRIVRAQLALEQAVTHLQWLTQEAQLDDAAAAVTDSMRLAWQALKKAKDAAEILGCEVVD